MFIAEVFWAGLINQAGILWPGPQGPLCDLGPGGWSVPLIGWKLYLPGVILCWGWLEVLFGDWTDCVAVWTCLI